MEKIFTYGTLQDAEVQQRIIGRNLDIGMPDTLRGYKIAILKGIHESYNIIQPQPGVSVEGVVYEVTAEELARIDDYEGDAYMRVSATSANNNRVWVYRDNPNSSHQHQIVAKDEP